MNTDIKESIKRGWAYRQGKTDCDMAERLSKSGVYTLLSNDKQLF